MEVAKGLAGIVVDETRICKIDRDKNSLYYFGYEISDLTAKLSYEEVFYLLVHGELPTPAQLDGYKRAMAAGRVLPGHVTRLLEAMPANADPMDVLRTGCSFLATLNPESSKSELPALAAPLGNAFVSMLLYWWQFQNSGRRIDTETGEDSTAGHFFHLLHGHAPDELHRRAIDVSLTIYAEHDFNASTYAARIATSTRSDMYSSIIAAIAALRGPLHGGANARVIDMLDRFESADHAEAGLRELLAKKAVIFGFGQRAYSTADPRNAINKAWAQGLSDNGAERSLFDVAERIEMVMDREKKMFANLDYYAAVIYRLCGLPTVLFPPMFLIARIPGLIAHIAEQRANNRLIHPSSRYIGPDPRPLPNVTSAAT